MYGLVYGVYDIIDILDRDMDSSVHDSHFVLLSYVLPGTSSEVYSCIISWPKSVLQVARFRLIVFIGDCN